MTLLAPHDQLSRPVVDDTLELTGQSDWPEATLIDTADQLQGFNPAHDAERLAQLGTLTDSSIELYTRKIDALTEVEDADKSQDKTIEELIERLRAQQAERDGLKYELTCAIATSSEVWEGLHIIKAQIPAKVIEQSALAGELSALETKLSEPIREVDVEFDACPCGTPLHDQHEETHLPIEHVASLHADLAAKKTHYETVNMDDYHAKSKRVLDMKLAIQKERANMITSDAVNELQDHHHKLNADSSEQKELSRLDFVEAQKSLQAFEAFIKTERQRLREEAMQAAEAERSSLVCVFEEKQQQYVRVQGQIDELEGNFAMADNLLRLFDERQAKLTGDITIAQERLDDIIAEHTARRRQEKIAAVALQATATSTTMLSSPNSRVVYAKQM